MSYTCILTCFVYISDFPILLCIFSCWILICTAVALVGLKETIYSDTDGDGVVELCAVVYEPNIECPIAFPFNISLSTSDGKSYLLFIYIHVYNTYYSVH